MSIGLQMFIATSSVMAFPDYELELHCYAKQEGRVACEPSSERASQLSPVFDINNNQEVGLMKSDNSISRHLMIVTSLVGLLWLAGCSGEQAPQPQATTGGETVSVTAAPQPPVEAQALTRLPVSLNSVMVALVNQAADPLWVAAWSNPQTDEEWRELERRAVQLELAGGLLSVPGTGPLDETWARNEGWKRWADQLRVAGSTAVGAVKTRDLQRISSVGDQIVEICEGCHLEFKLASPTGGEYGELSPLPSD